MSSGARIIAETFPMPVRAPAQNFSPRSGEKAAGMRGWRPAKNYAFRPFRPRAAIYSYLRRLWGRSSFFRRKCGIGRNTSQNATPKSSSGVLVPAMRDRIYPRWLDGIGRRVARTGGRSFTSSWLTRNLSGCHPRVSPARGRREFPCRARRELGSAPNAAGSGIRNQLSSSRVLKPSLYTPFLFSLRDTLV